MNFGYACLVFGVKDTKIKTCRLQNASPESLRTIIGQNLNALENMIDYNAQNGIRLYRISSDLIPFGSHEANKLIWQDEYKTQLERIGQKIKASGMRVSMHPGPYNVLNSLNPQVVQRTIDDLHYHESVLSSLQTDAASKIVLHIGGVFGDKQNAIKRFKTHFSYLDGLIKKRLVLENDERYFHIGDVLEIGETLGLPVVFDTLHHRVNGCESGNTQNDWIQLCKQTWKQNDGRQKIHYSQQDETKRAGAHSQTIRIREFLQFYDEITDKDIDVMLEVKDKNLSAVKCTLGFSNQHDIAKLENEWSRYKYLVLEKNPSGYTAIRQLLKDKSSYPVIAFYDMIETSLNANEDKGHAFNAAQHVWGYFKTICTDKEKYNFAKLSDQFLSGTVSFLSVKRFLYNLSVSYHMTYLLNSYFFLNVV